MRRHYTSIVVSSALFLACVMMLVGNVARIRVLDSLSRTLPVLVLMLLNLFIVWYAPGLAGRDG